MPELEPDLVPILARWDALQASGRNPHKTLYSLLAADTALELDGDIIGKPLDVADAHAILRRLSGRRHRVLSALALSDGRRIRSKVSISTAPRSRLLKRRL